MKKPFLYVISGALIVALTFILLDTDFRAEAVIGGVGNVTNTDNPHNFSSTSSGIRAVSEQQVCIFCHTPHHAITDTSLLNAPLWNHRLSAASYKVPALANQLTTPLNPPDGASKLCLSCHDGTIAIGNLATGVVAMASHPYLTDGRLTSGPAALGNDISAKHLVAIPVNANLIDGKRQQCINDSNIMKVKYPWESPNALGGTVLLRPTSQTHNGFPGIAGDDPSIPAALSSKYKAGYNYGVQCSSCHDPHLWANVPDANYTGYKFIVAPQNSMCLACHCNCDASGNCI